MFGGEIQELWQNTLAILRKELSPSTFDTWLAIAQPLEFDTRQHTLRISVPDEFAQQWLADRYYGLIKSTLEYLTQTKLDVEFVLSPLGATAKSSELRPQTYGLNPRYTFQSFVVGNSNRLAHAAALAVADSPARAYNPLFIYGGVGLGKTHLMQAIAHRVIDHYDHHATPLVYYISSEHFTNELITAIRDDRTAEFRAKYRNVDVLLIDDIQFLAGKERTQEEFFHTFNALYEANKQIVISSDRQPKEIPTLEGRLRSRFEWGLITDLQLPDFETRVAILEKKAAIENTTIHTEVLTYIAEQIASNIRELEGALNRLLAYARTVQREITKDLAVEALKDIISQPLPRKITISLIQEVVAKQFGLKTEDLKAKKRNRSVAYPRQIAMYLCRELTDTSLPHIGGEFGGRDHTTVIHACEKINTNLKTDTVLQQTVDHLQKLITG